MTLRFWKAEAYLEVEYENEVVVYDQRGEDGSMLHLDFETKMTDRKEPNQGVFQIYNLSASSRGRIESEAKRIRCYAGYDGNLKLIYDGEPSYIASLRKDADWVTRIQCGDGFAAFTTATTQKTYASGTDVSTVVEQIAGDMGAVVKYGKDTVAGVLDGSVTLEGLSKFSLEQILGDRDEEWSFQDGEIYITKNGQPIDEEAIVLRADTGLLEHPAITDNGVQVRAQLNPDIRPKKIIKLEPLAVEVSSGGEFGKTYEGFYLCQAVSFIGNNYGGPFDVVIEARTYG